MKNLSCCFILILLLNACVPVARYNSLHKSNRKLKEENSQLQKLATAREEHIHHIQAQVIVLEKQVAQLTAKADSLEERIRRTEYLMTLVRLNELFREVKLLEERRKVLAQSVIYMESRLAKAGGKPPVVATPISWRDEKYKAARTAKDEFYLSPEEKNVFYYLNLVRMNPPLFAETFLKEHLGIDKWTPQNTANLSVYEKSLYETLIKTKPLPPLVPDIKLWESARCHAVESGKTGYRGHNRTAGCQNDYWAECCSYGESEGLEVVLQLLIDNGVPSLGHRKICLGTYSTLGVAIQPHVAWSWNAVLDFK